MAVGDVIVEITSVVAGGNTDFQPSAGVEVIIFGTFPDNINLTPKLYDGTTEVSIGRCGIIGALIIDTTLFYEPIRVPINNGHYLRMYNAGGSNLNFAYFGVQTK